MMKNRTPVLAKNSASLRIRTEVGTSMVRTVYVPVTSDTFRVHWYVLAPSPLLCAANILYEDQTEEKRFKIDF